MSSPHRGDAGVIVTPEMQAILNKPGFINLASGGQRLRILYQDNSMSFNSRQLNEFAFACYFGDLSNVIRILTTGPPLNLTGTETPFKFGYVTLVVAGAQRCIPQPHVNIDHAAVLKFLLSRGAPPDVPDIVGYTALHHATMNSNSKLDLAKILLDSGADVNYRNRYGEVPLLSCFQTNQVGSVELLMEYGADLDIEDADHVSPRNFFLRCGPKITAAVTKWIRKRSGEEAPMDEKKCLACGKTNVALKQCSKCHSARYCSAQCQKNHWSTHKHTCRPFSSSNTVTLHPRYRDMGTLTSTSEFTRLAMGIETSPTPSRNERSAHHPSSFPKSVVIKVQVPYSFDIPAAQTAMSTGDLLVYTKKRDFVCQIKMSDNREGYKRISDVVRSKGVGGAKAYFAAELKSKDELVVKVDEVLAEQPF